MNAQMIEWMTCKPRGKSQLWPYQVCLKLGWYYDATHCICWVDLGDKTSSKSDGIGRGRSFVCFYVTSSCQRLGLSLNRVVEPFFKWFGRFGLA